MSKQIKLDELEIGDLVLQALSITNGWKKEVYVEDGIVTFSSDITQNSYTARSDDPNIHIAVAELQSMDIEDFEGFNKLENGKYLVDEEELDEDEAIDCIINYCKDEEYWNDLLEKILNPSKEED